MKLSLKSVARLTRQMATYQDSFVDVRKALDSMANNSRDSRLGASLRRVRERVNEGSSLYEAFNEEGDRYPLIFLKMTKIGEESGTLAAIYKTLADYLEQQLAMRNRFIGRLIYPCFMVTALIFVHSLLTAVWASVSDQGTDWGKIEALFFRQLLIDSGILAAVVGGILAARFALVGRSLTDFFILEVPPLRWPFRKLMLSRFSLSMYLMTGSAIGMPEAVSESGKATGNAYASSILDRAAEKIQDGVELTPALAATGLFPQDFIDIVQTAEESGTISESLRRVSVHYAEAADASMSRLVSGLAWGIYLFVAGIMAYYIITLYAGYVNNITNAMNQAN